MTRLFLFIFMIVLERINSVLLNEIIKRVNNYIRKIPKYPERMLLPDEYFSGQCERLFHSKDKGYYSIYRLFDHADINVLFIGKDISDIISHYFEEQIDMFYSYGYAGKKPSLELSSEFQIYCHQYALPPNNCPAYMVSSNMKEVYIPYFLEEFIPKDEKIIDEYYSGCYSGHQMCFDEKLGYLYVIPTLNGNLCIYPIGKEKKEAFDKMLKVAEKDTLHLPWKW